MQNKNLRKIHVGKSPFDKAKYQQQIKSNFKLDHTEEDDSILGSETSSIENEDKPKKRRKKRPQSSYKKLTKALKKHLLGAIITIILGLFGWLFINDFNFNADLKVAENNIENLEKLISGYKDNGIISENEYMNFNIELQKVKDTYAKLEKVNELEKQHEVLKKSIEKDVEYLKDSLNKIK